MVRTGTTGVKHGVKRFRNRAVQYHHADIEPPRIEEVPVPQPQLTAAGLLADEE